MIWTKPTTNRTILLTVMLPAILALGGRRALGAGAESGAAVEVHPAFEIERVAQEPTVRDPVDLAFDEMGRVYALEMGGYPIAPEDPEDYPGQIVLLEDTTSDGVFDRRAVFAEKFRYACSILPYQGGLLVASPPDLLFLKDTDGDGRADQREVLLTGFSVGNSQHNFNGLTYGLDNWVYAANGGSGGQVRWQGSDSEAIDIGSRDFRFDPRTERLEPIGRTTSGFGIAMDHWGRIFITHNMRHIHHLVFPQRYFDGNPYSRASTRSNISDHEAHGTSRIYAIGEMEPRVNHPEQAGYFSGACGITCYTGGAFPEGFEANVFVGDVVLNLVHRDILEPDGVSFTAQRGRDQAEFLASRDRWFRPVNMEVGPDGALYLLDFHRKVIEHPEWIPDELEKEMDLYAGQDQGRIYRITPKGGLPRVSPDFSTLGLEAIVNHLKDPNQWWRLTAQRVLVERKNRKAVPLLERLYAESDAPLGRAHALWTLHGMGSQANSELGWLDEAVLLEALQDPHPRVREHALVLAESGLGDSPDRLSRVLSLSRDPDPRARTQVALTVSGIQPPVVDSESDPVTEALIEILSQDYSSRWAREAVLNAAGDKPMPVWDALLAGTVIPAEGQSASDAHAVARELGAVIGRRKVADELARMLTALAANEEWGPHFQRAALAGLTQGVRQSPGPSLSNEAQKPLAAGLDRLRERDSDSPETLYRVWELADALDLTQAPDREATLTRAVREAGNPNAPTQQRLAYLRLLRFADYSLRKELLWELVDLRTPKPLEEEAIRQLVGLPRREIAEGLIARWASFSPTVRREASNYLIYRSSNHEVLLDALEDGDLALGELNLDLERRRRLLRSNEPEIRRRARQLFGDSGVVTRQAAIEKMRPALDLTGEPNRGKAVFEERCAQCHRIGNRGAEVGPDLTDIARKSQETLLHEILDPNAAVEPQFIGYSIETENRTIASALLIEQTEESVTIRIPGGETMTLPRREITDIGSDGRSLMPEGLEAGMTHQDLADLLAFLTSPR